MRGQGVGREGNGRDVKREVGIPWCMEGSKSSNLRREGRGLDVGTEGRGLDLRREGKRVGCKEGRERTGCMDGREWTGYGERRERVECMDGREGRDLRRDGRGRDVGKTGQLNFSDVKSIYKSRVGV